MTGIREIIYRALLDEWYEGREINRPEDDDACSRAAAWARNKAMRYPPNAPGFLPKPRKPWRQPGTPLVPVMQAVIDGLNEQAEHYFAGLIWLSRRPSTPTYWFFSVAIPANVLASRTLLEMLTPDARRLLKMGAIDGRYGKDEASMDRWCTCDDLELNSRPWSGPQAWLCYACASGAHERCSFGCTWEGEAHFPERLMRRAA